jgi:ribokinase
MAHIIVVGSTMTDMITYVDNVPQKGETVVGNTFIMGFGGKGANQAVMAKRLGAAVSMVNSVGDDLFGKSTLENFKKEGISTQFISTVSGASGVAPIWVDGTGDNRIIIIPGANSLMQPEQATHAVEELSDATVIVGQLEIPQAVTAAAFKAAKAHGMTTILNPAPYAPLERELLSYTDWLIPNESEFAQLHPAHKPPTEESITELSQGLGVRLLVTLGKDGLGYVDAQGEFSVIPAPSVSAIDTTGAGDAFIGAFAFGMAMAYPEETAMRLAIECASDSVTRRGTQTSYPDHSRSQEIIKNIVG